MVQGSISTYRLRGDLLEAYLRTQFPKHKKFNVQLSADGKEFYTFDTPEPLTEKQLKYIDEHVKLKNPNDEQEFL